MNEIKPHLACTFCAGQGCDDCQDSGLRITWAARGKIVGGHYRVSLWAGRRGMRAGLGELTMDHNDWHEFKLQGARMSPPMEITET